MRRRQMKKLTSDMVTPIAFTVDGAVSAIEADISIYGLEAILRAAYKFTDRAYLFLAKSDESSQTVTVSFFAKESGQQLGPLLGEFCNELIDQKLRLELNAEVGPRRELIVAQAFPEG